MIQNIVSLGYEPSSEPLHISAHGLLLSTHNPPQANRVPKSGVGMLRTDARPHPVASLAQGCVDSVCKALLTAWVQAV